MLRSYNRIFFASALLAVFLAAGFNAIVDPYGVYRWVDVDGFNKRKPKAGFHGAMSKPYRLSQVRPKTLLLGNSRVEAGLDPESSVWPTTLQPVFNMGMQGTGITVSLRNLRQALSTSQPTLVVLGLDFFDFVSSQAKTVGPADANEKTPGVMDRVREQATMLFSLNTLIDSVQTVLLQRLPEQADLTALGFNPLEDFLRFVRVDGHYVMFRQVDMTYLASYSRLRPAIFTGQTGTSPEFEMVRAAIKLCRSANVELVLFIHPYHAHMLENYRLSGMWPLFEQWKRALVDILDEAAAPPGAPTVQLLDFSGYNEITGETVPGPAEKGRAMRWYWEAGHYKRSVGDLMLSRIFGSNAGSGAAPPGFGVKLDRRNIDRHLAVIRDGRRQYADERREEIAALEKLAQELRERAARETGARRAP